MTGLPPGWTETTLGEVAKWGSGGTPKAGTAEYYGGEIPWSVIGDLNDGVVTSTSAAITAAGLANSSAKIVPPGSLLVAMYGSIGKLGITGLPMATNQAIAFAKPLEGVTTTRFLFWLVMWQRQAMASAGKGATQQNISQTILKSWPIPLPPLLEQHRIVEAIEERFTRLDAAEATLRRATANQERYLASLLQSMVTGADMPIRRLDELAETSSGGTPSRRDPSNFGGNVPWIKSGELNDSTVTEVAERITEAALSTSSAKLLPKGTLLVAMYGATIGKLGFVGFDSATTNQAVCAIRPGPDVLADYLFWVLRAARPSLTAAGKGGAQPNISQGVLRGWPIPLRSPSEQARVVCEIEERLQAMRTIMAATTRVDARSARLRRSILGQAFTGHLVSPEAEDEFVTGLRAPSPAAPAARRSGKES